MYGTRYSGNQAHTSFDVICCQGSYHRVAQADDCHLDPYEDIPSLAARLIEEYGHQGPLAKHERDSLERRITDRARNVPLDERDRGGLARLSYRQLRRLNKQQLTKHDKSLAKAIQVLKTCSK